MLHPILAERVRYLKEDEGGKNNMCSVIREVFEKDFEKAIQQEREAAQKEREHTALDLLRRDVFTEEEIAEISRLTLEEVKALNAQRTA